MDNADQNASEVKTESQPDVQVEPQTETAPTPVSRPRRGKKGIDEKIRRGFAQVQGWRKRSKDYYQQSPRLQKATYQSKFLPAFWTIAAIFSLLVNVLLVAVLISFGHNFFELKKTVSNGLVNGLYDNLALMDQAHIVTTVPVQTDVRLKDSLPINFNLPVQQDTQVSLTRSTTVAATTVINGSTVPLNVTLPAGTPLQLTLDTTVPVSTTAPVDLTVPVSIQVPMDVAIDQTDLHQSIVGMQGTIEPYRSLSSTINSKADISLCNTWWSGWMCTVVFGK